MDAGRTLAAPVVYNGGDSDTVTSYCSSLQWAVGAESTTENNMNPMMPEQSNPMDEQEDAGGYTIEIEVAADGKITVSVETDTQEEDETGQSSETSPEDAGQAVPNIREALKLAMDIYQNAGKQSDTNMADQQMEQGFKPGL